MKKFLWIFVIIMILVSITGAAWSAPRKVTLDSFLTPKDIEKVSGMTGVIKIARDPKIGAGGDLNFATSDKKLILMVQVVDKSQYTGYKKYFFKSDVKGLGDQAMQGATIATSPNNLVAFTKGNQCIALTVFMNANDMSKNMLTIEQTIELAKIIASRI